MAALALGRLDDDVPRSSWMVVSCGPWNAKFGRSFISTTEPVTQPQHGVRSSAGTTFALSVTSSPHLEACHRHSHAGQQPLSDSTRARMPCGPEKDLSWTK